ncbi:hypothetical protein E3P89_03140 [Wallemia ichthyophaga]|uniref:Uncharacterized protein n=1 Tax=Wallemia ichthyophaga TaxID=245174 RepID=A0A4T0HVL4_WALIC|nr:hypothetical protein E3P93_03130 [Wallemia ichthyophaga]TIB09713.1 hypothetical protein E3P90_03161 [Wallemia ichthyophaga]TIB20570.1 hypothetical protein E3P89_03140 [Wallemia ichthyophaga]TIB22174.1 hypothetical protein E3P88_03174 [Wallemia ichthyophaga]
MSSGDYQTLLKSVKNKGVVFTAPKDADAAIMFAQNGAKVLVGVDSTEAAQKLQGVANLSTHQLYVGDHLQVEAFFSLAIELLGNVDIIVANAIRADVQDWFSPENKIPTNVRPDMTGVQVNMYGQMFAIHYGANAFRKNPSADKVFVIDGDAGDIADQTPILKSTIESNYSNPQGLDSSGKTENWRANIINPTLADQVLLSRGKPYALSGVSDKISRRHAILVAATIQSSLESVVVIDGALVLAPYPDIALHGLKKVKARLLFIKRAMLAVRKISANQDKIKKWCTAAIIFGCTSLLARKLLYKIVLRTEPQQQVIATSMTKKLSWTNYDIFIGERAIAVDSHSFWSAMWSSKRFFTLPSGLKCVAKRRSKTMMSFVVTELLNNTIIATYEPTSYSYRKAGALRLFAVGHDQLDLTAIFMAIVIMIRIDKDTQAGIASGAVAGGGGG